MVNGLTIMVMGEIKTSHKLFISLPGRNTFIPPSPGQSQSHVPRYFVEGKEVTDEEEETDENMEK